MRRYARIVNSAHDPMDVLLHLKLALYATAGGSLLCSSAKAHGMPSIHANPPRPTSTAPVTKLRPKAPNQLSLVHVRCA